MKKQQKSMLVLAMVTAFITFGLFLPGLVGAGDLEPPPEAVDGGGDPVSTMKTLDEVEPRIPISPTDSFPFTIDSSGSYYLTGDLSVGGAGININADNVTIDLMGYTLSGNNAGIGIILTGYSNVEIRNGTIRDFTIGIFENSISGRGHRVIGVRVISNSWRGIYIGSGAALIKNCIVTGSGGDYGIYATGGSIITGNTAYDNGGIGIIGRYGSIVTGNTAYDNGGNGIYGYYGATVTNNTAYQNGDHGIAVYKGFADGNTTIENNQNAGTAVDLWCNQCTKGVNHALTP